MGFQACITPHLCPHSLTLVVIESNISATVNIFQLPSTFFPAIMESVYLRESGKLVELEAVRANRADYEWMKDFRQKVGQGKSIPFKTFNGDLISVNKCKQLDQD